MFALYTDTTTATDILTTSAAGDDGTTVQVVETTSAAGDDGTTVEVFETTSAAGDDGTTVQVVETTSAAGDDGTTVQVFETTSADEDVDGGIFHPRTNIVCSYLTTSVCWQWHTDAKYDKRSNLLTSVHLHVHSVVYDMIGDIKLFHFVFMYLH